MYLFLADVFLASFTLTFEDPFFGWSELELDDDDDEDMDVLGVKRKDQKKEKGSRRGEDAGSRDKTRQTLSFGPN